MEVFYKKNKNGLWECYDKNGARGTGLTKQIAYSQYVCLTTIGTDQKNVGYDMNKIEKVGLNNV